jgi:hypothetical protein
MEENRMIAEFMGEMPEQLSDCQYHTSWDWLMPVYQKICRIVDAWENQDWEKNTEGAIYYHIANERIADGDPIEEAYEYIAKFLKWYNENQIKINPQP